MHMFAVGHSVTAMVLSLYGGLLLVLLFRLEMAAGRRPESLDFAGLLDKLEPVQPEVTFLILKAGILSTDRLWRVSEDLDALRRVVANASVLARIAELDESEGHPEERKLAKEIRKECAWLKLCVHLTRIVLVQTESAPVVVSLLKQITKSYWSIVSRIHASYCLYHVRRSAAFSAACNLYI